MSDFLKRFRALGYDHPWQMYPYVLGVFFFGVSIGDWSSQMLFDRETMPFLPRMAFSATLALFVQYLDRYREARDRNRTIRGSKP